ncbi:MAG TPA: serine/threonine-protein kinase [Gemmataceae bacterium]|nr:serine/threonine-protein kinase [Gemmataceae bacterium]
MALPSSSADDRSAPPNEAPTRPVPVQLADGPSTSPQRADGGDTLVNEALTLFGRYQLLEVLAQGGMGIVYKALDTQLGRIVALKMIRSGSNAEPTEIERFQREARAIAQLRHDHIIELYDFDYEDGRFYYTMPFLPGGTLAARLRRGPANLKEMVEIVRKVALALHHAHEHHLLHRDVKPSNVLLDEKGKPLVADFGLAKFLNADSDLTLTQHFLGTPSYAAPELLADPPGEPSEQSDIWSLGVMLYELLVGRRPFCGGSASAVVRQIQTIDPPSPSSLRGEIDAGLEAIILKCLRKAPGQRYSSALELATHLENWEQGRPLAVIPEPLISKVRRKLAVHKKSLSIGLGLLSAILAVTCLVLLWPQSATSTKKGDPEEWYKKVQAELAKDKTVTLVPQKGQPPGFRVLTGETPPNGDDIDDKPFRVHSVGLTLIELLPDPLCDNYRFSVEVRHDNMTEGLAGLFVKYNSLDTDKGPIYAYFELGFADFGTNRNWFYLNNPDEEQGLLDLKYVMLRDPNSEKDWGSHEYLRTGLYDTFLPQRAVSSGPDAPWRRLTINVSSTEITFALDGEPLKKLVFEEFQPTLQGWKELLLQRNPEKSAFRQLDFDTGHGLGVFVLNGSAAFRSATISRIP